MEQGPHHRARKRRFRLCFFTWIVFSSIVAILYMYAGSCFEEKVCMALKEAIDQDYENRMLPYEESGNDSPERNMKIKEYTILTEDSVYHITFEDSIYVTQADQLANQFMLATYSPIRPDKLLAVFKDCLPQECRDCPCGVICQNGGKTEYSANDSITPKTAAFHTPVESVDIYDTVTVQGWMDYGFLAPLSFQSPVFRIIFILFVLAALFFLYRVIGYFIKTYKRLHGIDIIMNAETGKVEIDGKATDITGMKAQVLLLLVNSKEHFVSREILKSTFWPTDVNPDSKVDSYISFIRKELKSFPRYQLVTDKGKGYALVVASRVKDMPDLSVANFF